MAFRTLQANIDTYVINKKWYLYLPVWLFGFYIFTKLINFDLGSQLPFIIGIPQAFNFVLHELSHLFTIFLPSLITASAGSMSELILGLGLIIGAFVGRTYFASLFCFLWFMLATQSAADYMADAKAQSLPLISFGGGDPIHDWNYVFGQLGLLEQSTLIASTLRIIGVVAGLFGLIFTAWLIYRFAATQPEPTMTDEEAKLLHETASSKGLHAAPPEHFKQISEGNLYPTPLSGRLAERPPTSKKDEEKPLV